MRWNKYDKFSNLSYLTFFFLGMGWYVWIIKQGRDIVDSSKTHPITYLSRVT